MTTFYVSYPNFRTGNILGGRSLDTQDDLAEAQLRSLTAVVDYNKSLIEWDRLTGK